jgi:hypothetical protein
MAFSVASMLILFGSLLFLAREIWPQYFDSGLALHHHRAGRAFPALGDLQRNGRAGCPGSILAGIGGIFYYQNLTNDWESWAYIWALIPGFVGIGVSSAGSSTEL